ncbi:hypothetical protein KZ483_08060 [Paenibacillus sp. sptzw28]|uniref:hypothetical protein n=1 Tax=Paenibacillus sp. sptzw28 TaxID=715179 RepID=UPI001C6E48BC|nr:hypothetical protein [Paenibacillus sp. sptzw28]QYR22873.1 hypothetical protein KZ483_08060 [Paenibacillus sp. sptzw28]
MYDWRDGKLTDLGQVGPTLIVKGNYAVYNVGSNIYLRDLTTGESEVITDQADERGYDVDSKGLVNGRVVWSNKEDHQIYTYLAGATTKITNNTGKQHFSPITDGINIIYTRTPASGYGDVETIVIHQDDATGNWMSEVVLGTFSTVSYPNKGYSVNNGYVAGYMSGDKQSLKHYENYGTPYEYFLNIGEPIRSGPFN